MAMHHLVMPLALVLAASAGAAAQTVQLAAQPMEEETPEQGMTAAEVPTLIAEAQPLPSGSVPVEPVGVPGSGPMPVTVSAGPLSTVGPLQGGAPVIGATPVGGYLLPDMSLLLATLPAATLLRPAVGALPFPPAVEIAPPVALAQAPLPVATEAAAPVTLVTLPTDVPPPATQPPPPQSYGPTGPAQQASGT